MIKRCPKNTFISVSICVCGDLYVRICPVEICLITVYKYTTCYENYFENMYKYNTTLLENISHVATSAYHQRNKSCTRYPAKWMATYSELVAVMVHHIENIYGGEVCIFNILVVHLYI